MLTIKDLSVNAELDRAAMTTVHGGRIVLNPLPVGFFSAPIIDVGVHELTQGQSVVVDQSGNLGGFNAVANGQYQNGISGQVVGTPGPAVGA